MMQRKLHHQNGLRARGRAAMARPLLLALVMLGGCASTPKPPVPKAPLPAPKAVAKLPRPAAATPQQQPVEADPLLALLRQRGVLAEASSGVSSDPSQTVIAAMAFLDLPYVWGGSSEHTGFDCSGFTRYLFQHTLGVQLPRTAEQQAGDSNLVSVELDELQPGDLVFFNTTRRAFSHVGIFVGDGRFVHSPRVGAAVRLERMSASYWAQRFDGGRRPLALVAAATRVSARAAPALQP